MVIELTKGNYEALIPCLLIIFSCDMAVIISTGLDMYLGIKKSKKLGIKITSTGIRRTFEKLQYYLSTMFIFSLIDFLNPFWNLFGYKDIPILTIFWGIVLILTEMFSIREKAEDKDRRNSDAVAKEVLEKAVDILKLVKNGDIDIEKLKEFSNKETKEE